MKCKLLEQIWRMTKLVFYGTVIQCFLFTVIFAADINAQRKSIDEIYLDIDLKKSSIKRAFRIIEKETGLYFAYSDSSIDKNVKINYSSDEASLRDVLSYLSKNSNLKFKRVNETINVSRKTDNDEAISEILTSVSQAREITGQITGADDGEALPGVNIIVKGTVQGSVSDVDGNYTVEVPEGNEILVFSYVGFTVQEVSVGNLSVIDIVMQVDMTALQEVVVTALGVERTERALGYSVSEVGGEEMTQARETNIANSLVGRVAGVNVSQSSTGPSGSTRVVIRGNTSVTGNNQPLYVVDGTPIDNQNLGAAGMWGGTDKGDGISSLNPDDIETMTVLKGGGAAALYGSRASNGVILITTRTGNKSTGVNVELNSNYTFDKAVSYLDYQEEYGQGTNGRAPQNLGEARQSGPGGANLHTQSFGGKMDGSSVIQFDGENRPYSYAGNAMDQFYRTGSTFTNTLSVLGGNKDVNFRVSASDLRNQSIIPNSEMVRNTFNVNTNFKLKRFSGSVTGTYVLEDVKNSPRVSDVPRNANTSLRSWPNSVAVNIAEGDPSKLGADPDTGLELLPSNNTWGGNPYWASYQSVNDRVKDRLLGNIRLRYDFTDWLFIQGRVGIDKYNTSVTDITPTGQAYSPNGSMALQWRQFQETNNELIIGFDEMLDMGLGINAMVGGNMMENNMNINNQGGSVFAIPFFHSIQNITNKSQSVSETNVGINSVFYSAEVSYKSIYLTTTGRQDWFSTLDGQSVFYPSVSLSAVLSDWFDTSVFDFLKVRGAWSQVGGATTAYATSFSYGLTTPHNGFAQGRINGSTVPNSELVPLLASEIEIGADMRFFEGRLGIDFAWYDRKTEDDILSIALTPASGYTGTKVNIGEVTNTGIELMITGDVIKQSNFTWSTSFNYANNKSKVVDLVDPENDDERMRTARGRSLVHDIYQVEGLPYSQVMAYDYLRDEGGNIVLDDGGLPQRGEFIPWGTGIAPVTGGWMNNFRFGNFVADFLIDYQSGGYVASGTSMGAYAAGLHKNTLEGRGVGIGTVTNEDLHLYYERIANNIGGQTVYKSDYVKFRQLSFGYSFPRDMMDRTKVFKGLTLSFVARNLAILYKATDNIDPESAYQNGNSQGLEFGSLPMVRSFGFNLNAKF